MGGAVESFTNHIRGFRLERSEALLRLTANALPASAEQRPAATTSNRVMYMDGIVSKRACVNAMNVKGRKVKLIETWLIFSDYINTMVSPSFHSQTVKKQWTIPTDDSKEYRMNPMFHKTILIC